MSVTRVTRAGNEDRKPYSYWAWDLAKLANNGITRRIGAIRNKPATPNENPQRRESPCQENTRDRSHSSSQTQQLRWRSTRQLSGDNCATGIRNPRNSLRPLPVL